MIQLMYTTLVLLMIQVRAFRYKKYLTSMGGYSYRNMIEANLLILITVLIVVACNNLIMKRYRQETIRIRDLGNRVGESVWAYIQGRYPDKEDILEIRELIVENQLQLIGCYIINFTV